MTIPDTLITTYLHMTDYSQFNPTFVYQDGVYVMEMVQSDIEFYRFLYQSVGKHWRWRERLTVDDITLQTELDKAHTYVMYVDGAPAGYIELGEVDETDSMEIVYFGLREPFIGRGLGKHLLSYGIQQAWNLNAERVWVHTCNLDAPQALSNYKKRGFQIYDVTEEPMPEIFC